MQRVARSRNFTEALVDHMTTNENRVSDEFPELFHYTTVSAFENIYKEQKFRATHHEDLNDKSELGRFRLKIHEFIKPILRELFEKRMQADEPVKAKITEDGGVEIVIEQEAAMHLAVLHRTTFGSQGLRPFVCSFCAHGAQAYEAEHGLLSQWRGYGADGGVAIVLETFVIEGLMEHERDVFGHPINHIADVVYDNDNDRIRKDFHKVFEVLPKALQTLYSNERPDYEEIFEHFILGSTLVKHHGFHEENEIRIVVAPRTPRGSVFYNPQHKTKASKTLFYAQKDKREVRYIELFGNAPLPIKRVIVGPSRIQNFNYQKVTDLVRGERIDVVKSETPYLG